MLPGLLHVDLDVVGVADQQDGEPAGGEALGLGVHLGHQGAGGVDRLQAQALRVGDFLLLTIPGEPMVEYGFQIEKAIADRAIPIVIGYANGNLGYGNAAIAVAGIAARGDCKRSVGRSASGIAPMSGACRSSVCAIQVAASIMEPDSRGQRG